MALQSPGVSVTVTDEVVGGASGPGTVPLIIVATAQDKLDASGLNVAAGTTEANAGKMVLVSSQRELLQYYGVPKFYNVQGTQMHGYELNEYGLLAAHSYLGISNQAYVMRADIDLAQLEPLDEAPVGSPANGTYWLDLNESLFGLFVWNGTTWVEQAHTVIEASEYDTVNDAPKASLPLPVGAYVVAAVDKNRYFRRAVAGWELLDDAVLTESVIFASHINYPTTRPDASPLVAGDIWIKTTEPGRGSKYVVKSYSSSTGLWSTKSAPMYSSNDAALVGYGSSISAGVLYVQYDSSLTAAKAETTIKRHNGKATNYAVGTNKIKLNAADTGVELTDGDQLTINGTTVTFEASDSSIYLDGAIAKIISANISGITASKDAQGRLVISNASGRDIVFTNVTGTPSVTIGLSVSTAYSNWEDLSYEASFAVPFRDPVDGTLWYSTNFKVDILKNDGLGSWETLANEVYLQSAEPVSPVSGDLWIDTTKLDEYPLIRRYLGAGEWQIVDNTDQTSPFGIIFADARVSPTDTLDADAPDALLYPQGMLLWNTRYSTLNVKRWVTNYTFEGAVIGDRWVTASGNDVDGSPIMGRNAVKRIIAQAMTAAIESNDDIRSEYVFFNLLAAPGYPEVIDSMNTLNADRKYTGFVIGDVPFKLAPNSNAIQRWATNADGAYTDSLKGLVSVSEYMALYYPGCAITTNVDGQEVVVPASHMMLRVFAYNDQVAYQWFAPAGYSRGVVTNANAVGYLNEEDEFVVVALPEGVRDTLYNNNINPIVMEPNRGIVVLGNKTRDPDSNGSLTRINVARLVNYIRYESERLAKPYLFQPNDVLTRKNATNTFNRFLSELVTLRGLQDFVVVINESNNTPARQARNELWIDIACVPTFAVEFIYIPIRMIMPG